MNYLKVYKNIMEKAKSENRQKGGTKYYEKHHIIPDFMFKDRKRKGPKGHLSGNPNDEKNMVLLTAREHILSHILLAKALKGKRYWAQAASSVMFFYTKVLGSHPRQKNKLPNITRKYERYRALGLEGISIARKGTMPVKDSVTGEFMGSVSTNHSNVISGRWIHTSKGRLIGEDEKANRPSQVGQGNNNYKEMTMSMRNRVLKVVGESVEESHLRQKLFITNLKKEFSEFNKISQAWVLNNFETWNNLVKEYNEETGCSIQYNPYYRYNTTKKLLIEANKHMIWVTNGKETIRQSLYDKIPSGFTRGRTL
jgi:hypothetical protein